MPSLDILRRQVRRYSLTIFTCMVTEFWSVFSATYQRGILAGFFVKTA